MTEEKLQWIKCLIANNNLHEFYASGEWQALAAAARDEQHNECQRCKARGYYSPCEAVHHIKYVKKYPELALTPENLECLCRKCHEKEHQKRHKKEHRNEGFTNIERW